MNVPSGYTALDLIGFTDRDDYSSIANYVKNDLVHYNGRVWKCLIDDTTGIAPIEGANWTVWIDEAAYLSGLADVTITNPANGQVIRYNFQSGKWENVGVDSTPTSGSANLVQSGGVATQLANKANSADLATVATSGDYQDLNNLPTLADVATTGQYSDLLGLPTIPTVNNGTLTLQINGVTVETFNANDSNNKTANFNVPTKTSDLTNDSNFVSDANYQHITVDSAFSDTSTNPVQNKVVNSLKETLTQQINENGVKNILPTPYYQTKGGTSTGNSLTVTENSDGSVTINGTASAQSYIDLARNSAFLKPGRYILSGGKTSKQNIYVNATNNGSYVKSIVSSATEERAFTIDYNGYNAVTVGISIAAGETLSNVTFYPMVRSASITDPTYEPYAKTNQQLTKETTGLIDNTEVNGAVNMLPNNATTQVVNGITFTVNNDGTVTVNGTATTTPVTLDIARLPQGSNLEVGGTYKLSGTPNNANCFIKIGTLVEAGNGQTSEFIYDGRTVDVQLVIRNKATVSNLTFKPMITVASYNGDYVPYAKSNKELTENVKLKQNVLSNGMNYSRYIEWQSSATSRRLTMKANRGRKTILLIDNQNIAFIYFNENNQPIVVKVNGFTNLAITLVSGSLKDHGTAVYDITGLTAWGEHVIADWPSYNNSNIVYDDLELSAIPTT